MSDENFSNLNKNVVDSPYNIAGLKKFNPATPWAASAALTDMATAELKVDTFPTVQEMDDQYDSWLESGNPFNEKASHLQLDTSSWRQTSSTLEKKRL